jgi:type VI secretion system secreted protein VgrG
MNTKQLALPLLLALTCGSAGATVLPFLGTAQQFAVLGAQAVTNTGATTLHGDLGVAPGSAITGKEGIVFAAGGAIHETDAVAAQARSDASAAYVRLQALSGGRDLSGQDLGSLGTLGAGIYRYATSAALTGALTLDFANDPNGVIIFQVGSTLTTAANAVVNVINGTGSNGIYFQVGSSATLGAGSAFAGNILAMDSVSFGSGASIGCGRALALTAAVTMIGNRVSNDCGLYSPALMASDYGSNGYAGYGVAALPAGEAPEPAALALFLLGLSAMAWTCRVKATRARAAQAARARCMRSVTSTPMPR